jgi:ferredoxin, 2Fe-2S
MSGSGPHRVVIAPDNIVLEVEDGELLMAAANKAGYYWPTVCSGDAVCTRCFITVPDESRLSFRPMGEPELEGLRAVRWRTGDKPGERLACQARVIGDATVTKKYVRPAADGDSLPLAEVPAR